MRVLVVEDQVIVADRIAEGLRDHGIGVDVAYDGATGMEKAVLFDYDVIVLDRDLPRVHGDAVCAHLAASCAQARILMLTAAAGVEDTVSGLELGADDYVTKPFAFAELVARIRTLARRTPSAPPVVVRGDLVLDRARRRVARGGELLSLTRKEMGILEELMVADGAVVSAEELLDRVWDENLNPLSNIVSVTVARLRRKLGSPARIETVIGSGYRLA
jgi:DNA-binding response OmpR family regulator